MAHSLCAMVAIRIRPLCAFTDARCTGGVVSLCRPLQLGTELTHERAHVAQCFWGRLIIAELRGTVATLGRHVHVTLTHGLSQLINGPAPI